MFYHYIIFFTLLLYYTHFYDARNFIYLKLRTVNAPLGYKYLIWRTSEAGVSVGFGAAQKSSVTREADKIFVVKLEVMKKTVLV